MKTQRIATIAELLVDLSWTATPALAVSKEIIQLQTQVQQLQDQMAQMKQSFDERMGVLQHLVEQSTDNMNKVSLGRREAAPCRSRPLATRFAGHDEPCGAPIRSKVVCIYSVRLKTNLHPKIGQL